MDQDADADKLIKKVYDDLRYDGAADPHAHPDHLATISVVFGLNPPPVKNARVLEVGCGMGMNLISQAEAMPSAQFLGIDLVASQIEFGQKIIHRLGLKNITLRAQSIADMPADERSFDYIIAAGVLSWVPENIRRKLLELCRSHLSPNGIAYITYNALPGGYARNCARDLMRFHAARYGSAIEKVDQAREILAFVSQSADPASAYAATLREELEHVRNRPDFYVMHDHLEPVNEAFYFRDFMKMATDVGLQYVSEGTISQSLPSMFPRVAVNALKGVAQDAIDFEQYMDFIRATRYRETLLCRQGLPVDRRIQPDRIRGLRVAATLQPRSGQAVPLDDSPVSFVSPQNIGLTTPHPATKLAIAHLHKRWPASVGFDELQLLSRAGLGLSGNAMDFDQRLAGDLLTGYLSGSVRLFTGDDPFTTRISDRPAASPLARFLAESSATVFNRRLDTVTLTDSQRRLLRLMDGSHSTQGLMVAMRSVNPPVQPGSTLEADLAVLAAQCLLVTDSH